MTPGYEQLVRESWRRFEPMARQQAAVFYERLFELDPSLKALFAATDMEIQGGKLMTMLGEIVRLIDDPHRLVPEVAELGRRHTGYGVRDAHYDTVGEALLWTLERALGGDFTPEVKLAWAEAYRLTASVIRRASGRPSGATRSSGSSRVPE